MCVHIGVSATPEITIYLNSVQLSISPYMRPINAVIETLPLRIKLAFWLARRHFMRPAAIERPDSYSKCMRTATTRQEY
jgi:hypothetical protein